MGQSVRILNEKGVEKFREYLSGLRDEPARHPPYDLLDDPWHSAKIPGHIEVEKRDFADKLQTGKYLFERLSIIPHFHPESNIGLWSWLSLYYFDQVCPFGEQTKRVAGRDYRYILDLDYRRYYNHLLLGPYNIYRLHRDTIPLLLHGKLSATSKICMEFASRQAFITNKGIMEAATYSISICPRKSQSRQLYLKQSRVHCFVLLR